MRWGAISGDLRLQSFIINLVQKIHVRTKPNAYDVMIGAGLLRRAGREVRRVLPSLDSRVFVITSPNVRRHWGEALEKSLQEARLPYEVLEMHDGEPAKRLHTVEQLADRLVDAKADRRSLLVAFGGGVVGDCAGFLAAIFMRGIPVVQIPTTVVAQVDASIGGKTGVNLRAGKNLVGAFHQPRAVLVDPDILQSLTEREFRSGLFESLKCGVIRDHSLFDFMETNPKKILARNGRTMQRVIADSIRVKADVVSADEKESGLRRILNFGHTIGHALEAATEYSHFLHGEAVALGMMAASHIARDAGLCSAETASRITSATLAYGPLPPVACEVQDVMGRLGADKKTVGGTVHFVLPQKIGKVKISGDVPSGIVHDAVESIRHHA
ncbi:MAG: 3-dehydroquinate synthase [Acidobacteriia bacterium]|nr:3-dehydroquinate synthase [Terriglobia bacterium]